MSAARTIRPAETQPPLSPGRTTVVEKCVCVDPVRGERRRYVYAGTPDPVLIGDWRKAHEGCEG